MLLLDTKVNRLLSSGLSSTFKSHSKAATVPLKSSYAMPNLRSTINLSPSISGITSSKPATQEKISGLGHRSDLTQRSSCLVSHVSSLDTPTSLSSHLISSPKLPISSSVGTQDARKAKKSNSTKSKTKKKTISKGSKEDKDLNENRREDYSDFEFPNYEMTQNHVEQVQISQFLPPEIDINLQMTTPVNNILTMKVSSLCLSCWNCIF